MKTDFVQIMTTGDSEDDLQRIAQSLVEQRLAACAQIVGPIRSVYRWKGVVETAEEWLCLVKTSRPLVERVEKAVRAIHPYETPEFVVLPIAGGSADYLGWMGEVLAHP